MLFPLEFRSAVLALVDALSEENLGPQRLKAVAATEPIHDAYETVQGFGVGIGHWMVEVAENPRCPVLPDPHQVGEGRCDLRHDAPLPLDVAPLCLVR